MTPWIQAAARDVLAGIANEMNWIIFKKELARLEPLVTAIIERHCQAASNAALGIEQREEWRGE